MTPASDTSTLLKHLLAVELLPFYAGCQVHRSPHGRIITHAAFSFLYDANLILIDSPTPIGVKTLEAEAAPHFELSGVTHLRFVQGDPERTAWMIPRFVAAGYRRLQYLIMAHTRPSDRAPVPEIRMNPVLGPTGHGVLDRIDNDLMREVPWNSPMIRAALRTRRREVTNHIDLRWFWASINGVPAGSIALLRAGSIASIQSVSTRPALRGRAVATTMVLEMVETARALGHSTVCLMTEAEDWPRHLYAQLGFEAVGYVESFLKSDGPG